MSTGRKRGRREGVVSAPNAQPESDALVSEQGEDEELTPDDANTAKKPTMSTGRKRGRREGVVSAPDAQFESDALVSEQGEDEELTPDDANTAKKPVRGKTTLQALPSGQSVKITIEWNEKGQPVGDLSRRFSSTIGVLVREQVPINIVNWHKVDMDTKNEVWGLLMQKYLVDLAHKTFILQQMGRLWRAYKSELSTSIRRVIDSQRTKTECARLLGMLRPADVPQNEWDAFVTERRSEAWKEKSEKMKIIRGRQLLPHTLSRNGYARYEYDWNRKNPGRRLCRSGLYIKGHEQKIIKNVQMAETINRIQEKLDAQPPNEGPIPVKYDALSQVLGNERPGRVRGLGAGVTPSRVDAQLQSASWRQDLEQRLQANSERTRILEDIIFNWSQSATGGGNGHGGNSDDGSKRTSNPAKSAQDGPENGEARTNSSPQTGTSKSVQGGTVCVNDRCELLDWDGTGQVVARGKISATDPTTKVHGYKLGPDCYRVAVEEAVVPRAEFFRYQPEFSAMEDAVGSTIAWPTKYIVPL